MKVWRPENHPEFWKRDARGHWRWRHPKNNGPPIRAASVDKILEELRARGAKVKRKGGRVVVEYKMVDA